ncbi:MAG: DUF6778 family protein [Pseudomonadota bacterium]
MRHAAKVFMASALCLLAACASSPEPAGSSRAGGWQLDDVSVRFGPTISRTASGQDYGSNFVWNGFGGGNRKKQVLGIVRSGVREGADGVMTGQQPVDLRVQINVFHALTEFGRTWCCGFHDVDVDLAVVDKATGSVLESQENVQLGTYAYGGFSAAIAEAAGLDQATRIRASIVEKVDAWLRTN